MQWRIVKQTDKAGPYTTEQIHGLLEKGTIDVDQKIESEDGSLITTAGRIPENEQSPPPTKRAWTVDDAIWYTSNEDEQVGDGPFSLRDLQQRALQKQLEPKALIWRQRSNGEWVSHTLKYLVTMAQGRRANRSRTSVKRNKRPQSLKVKIRAAPSFLRSHRKRIISLASSIIPSAIIAFFAYSLLSKIKIHSVPDAPETTFFDEESLDSSTPEASPSKASTGLISFSQCRGIARNASDLDYAQSMSVSLLGVSVKELPTECNPCKVPASLRDGTELMLMTDTLDPWRDVVANENHLIDVCGTLNHRMGNIRWFRVKVMRHSVYSR